MESFFDAVDAELDGAQEPKCVEAGEYEIGLIDWKRNEEGNIVRYDAAGFKFIMPNFEIQNHPDAAFAKPFSMYLRLPDKDNMTSKELNGAKWGLKCFLEAFDVELSGRIDWEEMIGKQAEAMLIVQPDAGYGEQNAVKRFMRRR